MTAPISEFKEGTIYLDTMLPYALLRAIDPEVNAFFRRIQSGDVVAFTSVLTFDELAYRLLLALVKDKYQGSPLDRLRDKEQELIAEFAPIIKPHLALLQHFPNLTIIDVASTDLQIMMDAMIQYTIRPRDALHWAAMQRVGCVNLASNDQHFDQIPSIYRFIY